MDLKALNALIPWFDFIGIIAFALSGVLAGMRRHADPVGIFIAAFTTAFGGGMVRDLMIDRRPFYWTSHEAYIWACFAIVALSPVIYRVLMRHRNAFSWYIFADAIGLGVFVVSGTAQSLAVGLPMLSSAIIGCITGVFGGLLRDVFLNKMPSVVADRQPYATVGFVGAWLFIGMLEAGISLDLSVWASMIFTTGLRMLCVKRKWTISYSHFYPK
jgi:uncharacterized membrane protein YeiH